MNLKLKLKFKYNATKMIICKKYFSRKKISKHVKAPCLLKESTKHM